MNVRDKLSAADPMVQRHSFSLHSSTRTCLQHTTAEKLDQVTSGNFSKTYPNWYKPLSGQLHCLAHRAGWSIQAAQR